jgi:uncharacterized protein YprB with RNaseH-like and TPR domain
MKMSEAIEYLKQANLIDKRQEKKVLHKLNEIIGISFFSFFGNANNLPEIEVLRTSRKQII